MAAAGQPHNLGSFPVTTSQELRKEGRHMPALQLQLGTATRNGVNFSESFWQSVTAAAHLAKNAGLYISFYKVVHRVVFFSNTFMLF